MIEVQNLTKRYGKFSAVDRISFSVLEGEIFGFLGPNGAGMLVHLNPLSYGIDGLRGAFGRALLFNQAIDFVVLGGVTAILLGVGSYLFSRIQL